MPLQPAAPAMAAWPGSRSARAGCRRAATVATVPKPTTGRPERQGRRSWRRAANCWRGCGLCGAPAPGCRATFCACRIRRLGMRLPMPCSGRTASGRKRSRPVMPSTGATGRCSGRAGGAVRGTRRGPRHKRRPLSGSARRRRSGAVRGLVVHSERPQQRDRHQHSHDEQRQGDDQGGGLDHAQLVVAAFLADDISVIGSTPTATAQNRRCQRAGWVPSVRLRVADAARQ